MAWKGALLLGAAVWLINLEHPQIAAWPAALKQAAYTYFIAGFIVRQCENIAVSVKNRRLELLPDIRLTGERLNWTTTGFGVDRRSSDVSF